MLGTKIIKSEIWTFTFRRFLKEGSWSDTKSPRQKKDEDKGGFCKAPSHLRSSWRTIHEWFLIISSSQSPQSPCQILSLGAVGGGGTNGCGTLQRLQMRAGEDGDRGGGGGVS